MQCTVDWTVCLTVWNPKGYLIAVIVPDIDGINLWCSENNMLLSAAEACKNVVSFRLVSMSTSNVRLLLEGIPKHAHQQSAQYQQTRGFGGSRTGMYLDAFLLKGF